VAGSRDVDTDEVSGCVIVTADLKREFGGIGWWLDTGDMTADQTAELVVAEVATRTTALLPGWSAWLRGLHDV